MKKIFLLLLTLLVLTGCYTMENVNLTRPGLDGEKSAGIGDIFFEREEGQIRHEKTLMGDIAVADDVSRFDLRIAELNDQKIGLLYAEYFHNPRYPRFGEGWMIKQGFNMRLDYALADKVIRFKGYEFEIIGIGKGQIKYKRIK